VVIDPFEAHHCIVAVLLVFFSVKLRSYHMVVAGRKVQRMTIHLDRIGGWWLEIFFLPVFPPRTEESISSGGRTDPLKETGVLARW